MTTIETLTATVHDDGTDTWLELHRSAAHKSESGDATMNHICGTLACDHSCQVDQEHECQDAVCTCSPDLDASEIPAELRRHLGSWYATLPADAGSADYTVMLWQTPGVIEQVTPWDDDQCRVRVDLDLVPPHDGQAQPLTMTGRMLRAMREALGYSAADAADLLGIAVRTVERWEALPGKTVPTFAAHAIAKLDRETADMVAYRVMLARTGRPLPPTTTVRPDRYWRIIDARVRREIAGFEPLTTEQVEITYA